jgi:Txe/YoeB family toxin of Txe-Axe toxin-antitoxin module
MTGGHTPAAVALADCSGPPEDRRGISVFGTETHDDRRYKQNQEKIQAKAHELQELTCDLCKRLRESPNVSENLLKIQNERSHLITIFESFRTELLSKRSFQGIWQKAEKMKAHYDDMLSAMETDRAMHIQIEQLSTNVSRTEQEMQQKLERLEGQIKEQRELPL